MKPVPQSSDRDQAVQQLAPVEGVLSGPSFPLAIKALATLLVIGLIVAGVLAVTGPCGMPRPALEAREWAFLLGVVAVVGSGYWGMLSSHTSIGPLYIEQSWLWHKRVSIADITQVKLIRLPGLDWIIVPRLVVRTGFGLATFQTADPAVLARFRLLAHGSA